MVLGEFLMKKGRVHNVFYVFTVGDFNVINVN